MIGLGLVTIPTQSRASDRYGNPLSTQNTQYRPSEETVKIAQTAYEATLPRTPPPYYGSNCVAFAKAYLGQTGTWGNGGRQLTLNSDPTPNAIVIFTYTHVAIVQEVTETQILIIESNYHAGQTSLRWLDKTDPTIKGFHSF